MSLESVWDVSLGSAWAVAAAADWGGSWAVGAGLGLVWMCSDVFDAARLCGSRFLAAVGNMVACSLPLDGQFTKQNASGVTVWILDTGIRGDHEEFDGIINATDTCHFSVISSEPDALTDKKGHGQVMRRANIVKR